MRLFSIVSCLALASSVTMGLPLNNNSTTTKASSFSSSSSVSSVSAPSGPNVRDGVYISCNKPGMLAMTFDDGPYKYSWDLAKLLNKQDIKATFFINGKNWVDVESEKVQTSDGEKTYLEVIKHFKTMNHEIASHTYEHRELAGLSAKDIEYQMNTQSNIIKKAIGLRPAIMRPPAGNVDANTLKVLRKLGYHVVNWDIDTNDWRNHNLDEEEAAYKTIDKDTSKTLGHIALQHEVYDQTVNELTPWAIKYIKSKKYKFVTVSECIGKPAYYK